jgi:hypothetical protein
MDVHLRVELMAEFHGAGEKQYLLCCWLRKFILSSDVKEFV